MSEARLAVVESASTADTLAIGRALGGSLAEIPGRVVVSLEGDLGAGKTLLARGIGEGLGVSDAVTSPTYVIRHDYETGEGRAVFHVDAFRLQDPGELEPLVLEDAGREDAIVLEANSRDVAERVGRINQTAERLCDFLRAHPIVERIDYPKFSNSEYYRAFMKPAGGFGGLFSMLLKEPARNAPRFFDALEICKGPNLGTNFSLCCPYTILAHYNELDFVESCGISRYLLRISVGLEDSQDLIDRFEKALEQCR